MEYDKDECKAVNIVDILGLLNFTNLATRELHYYGMYKSPFRPNEKDASFKIDYQKNLWFDFGEGVGGDSISLVQKLRKCSFQEALGFLASVKEKVVPLISTKYESRNTLSVAGIEILTTKELCNYPLLQYIASRNVPLSLARQYCCEVHYRNEGKEYYAVGFKNDKGGYVLRSKYFKGTSGMDISQIHGKNNSICNIYEGFFSFLSHLALSHRNVFEEKVIVLNSLSNINKINEALIDVKTVQTFFDNDPAGRKAFEKLKLSHPSCEVNDMSFMYSEHNDLNDWLVSKKNAKQMLSINLK